MKARECSSESTIYTPKTSDFNSNIPNEKRNKDLQDYLNKVLKINCIETSYYFNQFINYSS